jgi:hypothetical protein
MHDPAAPEFDATHFLHERYVQGGRRSAALALYYAIKPLVPRSAQLALRRAYARRQRQHGFPAWPVEPILVRHQQEQFRRRIAASEKGRAPFVGFWPSGHRFCFVLTHDVEGPAGVDNVRRVRELERRHGLVSSWNFVPEDYPVDPAVLDELRASGCEIGVHGVTHDGKLFQDRARFIAALPKIEHYLREWDAVGFRSPATRRNADWMAELPVLYDSSFPDTDPYEPQPGGCCSIFPFFFGDVVELPITLVQDHTLFEILGARSIDCWVAKTEWIAEHHGLVNVIVHPDYMLEPERLCLYDELLGFLAARPGAWHALPRDVARWWRRRAGLTIADVPGGGHEVAGDGGEASVAYAREVDGSIVYELGGSDVRSPAAPTAARPSPP